MTMWLYRCRACRILLGPREDVMVDGHYYHYDCAPTDDEVDRRLEERAS